MEGTEATLAVSVSMVNGEARIVGDLVAQTQFTLLRQRIADEFSMPPALTKIFLDSRAFGAADLQAPLSKLRVCEGSELTCAQIPGLMLGGSAYALTEASVASTPDGNELDEAVEAEFGPDGKVADFSTFREAGHSVSKEEFTRFLDDLGLCGGAKFRDGGKQTYYGDRLYFCDCHNGKVPPGWLVHKTVHHNVLDLGSWMVGPMQILVEIGGQCERWRSGSHVGERQQTGCLCLVT